MQEVIDIKKDRASKLAPTKRYEKGSLIITTNKAFEQ